MNDNYSTFVLVQGAWHGGWCYAETAKILRDKGHVVYTPSLTGVSDRKHLNGPTINLTTHVLDIVNLIEAERITNVILVGHSASGYVISLVSERIPSNILVNTIYRICHG